MSCCNSWTWGATTHHVYHDLWTTCLNIWAKPAQWWVIIQFNARKWTSISAKMLIFSFNKCFWRWHTYIHIYRGSLVARLTNHSAEELPAKADRTFESDHTNILLIKWTTEEACCVTDACNYETLVAHFQCMEAAHSAVSRENCTLSHWLLLLLKNLFSLSDMLISTETKSHSAGRILPLTQNSGTQSISMYQLVC